MLYEVITQTKDADLKAKFESIAKDLTGNENVIVKSYNFV